MACNEARHFRSVCEQAGLAVTHQRQVLYEVLSATEGHPSPEEVYDRVKRRIPSISLATVYKNIHLFIEAGIFDQVSHAPWIDAGGDQSHPAPSSGMHRVQVDLYIDAGDIDAGSLSLSSLEHRLSGGFLVQRMAVDVLGLCEACQRQEGAPPVQSN